MARKEIVLEWKYLNDVSGGVLYYVNGEEIGEGENGFTIFLERLRSVNIGTEVIIRYDFVVSSGGEPFEAIFPFSRRQHELDEVIKQKNLSLKYEVK
ncbi:Uncharacterised protein [uncultured archaeon]|nr:Uncharacterised protein [uncultured archaeon]